nr:SDR family NAD(P)-dependent oxidoreductase [Candidatus Microthrix sp.]
MGRLDGKVAIITGAARGMGEAEARLFASEGARVVIADVLTEEGAAVAADIGEAARFVPLDVTDEAAWLDLMKITTDVFGCPDVLVNNAGVLVPSPIRELEVEQLRYVLDVNLLGPILGVKVVGAAMADAGRGSIVNVSSTGGLLGMSMISSYVASKWGLRGFSRSAAIELGPNGVRVNSLHPGGVTTPMVGVTDVSAMVEPPGPGEAESNPTLAASDAQARPNPSAGWVAQSRSRGWRCFWHRTSRRTARVPSSSPTVGRWPDRI